MLTGGFQDPADSRDAVDPLCMARCGACDVIDDLRENVNPEVYYFRRRSNPPAHAHSDPERHGQRGVAGHSSGGGCSVLTWRSQRWWRLLLDVEDTAVVAVAA